MSSRGCAGPSGLRRKRDTEEHQKERRRALQARHRANLATLFETLKTVVCPTSNKMPAKWKILDHAKGFLKEQEAYLSRLMLLKGIFLGNEGGPCSLDEVRAEYRRLQSHSSSLHSRRPGGQRRHGAADREDLTETSEEDSAEETLDDSVPSQTSINSLTNILEFEGYLLFYRQTLEKLVCSGVLSPGQTGLAVVSEAISGLWDSFSPERRAAYQTCPPQQSTLGWEGPAERPPNPGPDTHLHLTLQPSTQANSQGASSPSPHEEDLLQDAYDVVKKEMDSISDDSPVLAPPQCGDFEKLREIYKDIMCFVKTQMVEEPGHNQDLCLSSVRDYEEIFLQCSESFDSEDM
ncbi:stimulated by retinoic acid gene 8 protein homolog isoform X2 [Salmo trutta]|uniref:Stimulated by retinoic acid gene 8 protein homolog n=1 Tax=Salmo trutta TaxID=8032 RepID=A0A673ZT21_SALTR|nr:stimulated by retinoic acid gene 8 protein homolog isoform X1 [Salmo trutta]XP_029598827.1 stimulated by retinoic acid gene 8 protein homolog isoform X2 [Salmo trutta]